MAQVTLTSFDSSYSYLFTQMQFWERPEPIYFAGTFSTGFPVADLMPMVQELGAMHAKAAHRALTPAAAEATKAAASNRLLNLCQVASEGDLPDVASW